MRRSHIVAGLFLALAILAQCATVAARDAFVVRVEDGSTIAVSDWPHTGKIDAVVRLYGIGTPTLSQPCGKEARDFLAGILPEGRRVNINTVSRGDDGYEIALVQTGGHSVNYLLITEGLAWVGRKTCKAAYCRRWYIEERRAVTAKKGIWGLDIGTEPWQWGR